jgi:site-specific recombinase XerD
LARGPRDRLARGIYRDRSGLAAVIQVGQVQVEKRFPLETPLRDLQRWRDSQREILRHQGDRPARGTFAADAARYLRQVHYLASWSERRAEVRAWVARFGRIHRSRLTSSAVRRAFGDWLKAGVAPKTINNRLQTLRHLYRTLDGRRALTPCDEVSPLPVPRAPRVVVPVALIRHVEAQLRVHEAKGWLRSAKTRGRFMVLATTGRRPSELKRAQPEDVDLDRRVWVVRDGKGGYTPGGLYLNDEMLLAWRVFLAADAFGPFCTSAYVRTLQAAGWPTTIRPYQLRHAVAIESLERGTELADVSAVLGHTRVDTTRRHYAPVLESRMQRASERLEGRIGWLADRETIMGPAAKKTKAGV